MRNERFTAPAVVTREGAAAQRLTVLLLILLGLCVPRMVQAAPSVIAYPLASVYIEGTSWKITAKGADGITVPLHVRAYEPDAGNGNSTVAYYYCHCAIAGSTAFAVDATQTITSSSVSPKGYNITTTLSNGTTTNSVLNFTLPSTKYIEVSINSKAVLCILADPPESSAGDPNSLYNVVTHYGADTTGTSSDTMKIQDAINAANAAGGGCVYFPSGVYLSGKLTLKSNVQMYFEGGSVLYADKSLSWAIGGNHFISTASGTTNVEVYGRGEIDCRGSDIAGYKDPGSNSVPQVNPIFMNNTSNFQVYGILCSDSTGFTIQPASGSTDVVMANVKICNRKDWHYNDGIDFTDAGGTSATPSTVTHCFVRTGDDACCAKTGYFSEVGPSAYITYNDIVVDTGVGDGFSVGAETNNDIHDITAENFQVINCHRGIAVIHWEGPGHWYNLTFKTWRVENIVGGETNPPTVIGTKHTYINCPIRLEIYNHAGAGEGPISSPVLFQDLTFDNHGPYASYLWGDTSPNTISGVTFTNVNIAGTHILGWGTLMVNKGDTSGITFN
jgi:polygalacturonase